MRTGGHPLEAGQGGGLSGSLLQIPSSQGRRTSSAGISATAYMFRKIDSVWVKGLSPGMESYDAAHIRFFYRRCERIAEPEWARVKEET